MSMIVSSLIPTAKPYYELNNDPDMYYPESPYKLASVNMPQNMTMVMPSASVIVPDIHADMTPGDLLHALPSIVNTDPVQLNQPVSVSGFINDHSSLATLALLGLAYYMFKGKL